ncbi:hypothetical protein ACVW0I_004931 [Bradyrhizobium sp. LM6.11]
MREEGVPAYTVGNTENASPARRRFSSSTSAVSLVTLSTREDGGPWRHSATMSATCFGDPTNSASTLAVAAIADPAFETARRRLVLDPGPITDALHAAADHDLKDCPAHFFGPRKSALRAFASASRMTRLVKSDAGRPLRFFGAVPSRSAFCVSYTAWVAAAIGAWP